LSDAKAKIFKRFIIKVLTMQFDVIIIGAGAAGMMCAATAGQRGRRVLLLDHAKKIGEKIRISGGGRCNFTNVNTAAPKFLSQNPHFCKSALSQYTQADFIELVKRYGIAYHEKTLGQLFCDESAQQIIDMLLSECEKAGVRLQTETNVSGVEKEDGQYLVHTDQGEFTAKSLVIATGGLSIPKIGATKFGYDIARQFGLNIVETRAGLVPLTFQAAMLERCKALSGVSVDSTVRFEKTSFDEALLFTHRGLSGPSILQISSYWREGEEIEVNLAAGKDTYSFLLERKKAQPRQEIHNALADVVPARLAQGICEAEGASGRIADLPDKTLRALADAVHAWRVLPSGTEGYRTAEVTLGGVDTNDLSSKTMEAKAHAGLYFIGEVVDVTGHLGGYNFQWAWSSGYVAGQNV
jgi:hypothetical protein